MVDLIVYFLLLKVLNIFTFLIKIILFNRKTNYSQVLLQAVYLVSDLNIICSSFLILILSKFLYYLQLFYGSNFYNTKLNYILKLMVC